jgi:hypothetical protein
MFKSMDADGNGALDTSEFQCKCSDFGMDDASIQQLFLQLDTNSDGNVSLDEFTAGWAKFQEAQGGGGSSAGPTEIPFAGLNDAIAGAFAEGKAVLICDPTEKTSSFLQYNASVMDCKGIFVLDKIHGKSPEEIKEKARAQLVGAMKGGQWLHMELGKAAPGIGELSSEDTFPGQQLLLPNFGKDSELHDKFVQDGEKEGGVFVPKGDWSDKGHAVVATTLFQPEDYREFLQGSWPEFPFDQMAEFTVKHD